MITLYHLHLKNVATELFYAPKGKLLSVKRKINFV
jgi:hypothetical protein